MEPDPLSLIAYLLSLMLVGAAAAAEIALVTVNRHQIRELGDTVRRVQLIEALRDDSSRLLATLILMKYMGLVIAGAMMVQLLPTQANFINIAWLFCLTCMLLIAVHTVGRAIALRQVQWVAFQLAPIVWGLTWFLRPITTLLYAVSSWFGVGYTKVSKEHLFLSEDGLRLLLNLSEEEENIQETEKEMIASILEMNETIVREIMVPRIDMVAIDVETSLGEALDIIIGAGHSRIPVYEDSADSIVGVLYAKDLLKCFRENRDDVPIRELLRLTYFVPASKKVNILFGDMQKERVHIALIVDEYGGIAGLVTIEDVLEEIVGEIQDEYDSNEESLVELIGPDTYVLNSRFGVDDLAKLLEIDTTDTNADTVGGLLYILFGHVPEQGEITDYEGWRFTILSVQGHRIEQIRAEFLITPPTSIEDPAHRNHMIAEEESPPMTEAASNADSLNQGVYS